jgi:hypothetical protein
MAPRPSVRRRRDPRTLNLMQQSGGVIRPGTSPLRESPGPPRTKSADGDDDAGSVAGAAILHDVIGNGTRLAVGDRLA